MQLIRKHFGTGSAKYVSNKHTGGESGKKGSRYEDLFIAFKAAQAAAAHLDFPEGSWPFLAGQRLAFIDDVVLRTQSSTDYFQLKNSNSVSWGTGEQSIKDDFSKQFVLATLLGEVNSRTHLIVSSKTLRDKLSNTLPDEISGHTTVGFFPYVNQGRFNALVMSEPEVQAVLAKIVRDENASWDSMESAIALILVACNAHPNGCSVEDIVKYVQEKYPGQLRMIPARNCEETLTPAFVSILAKVTGLYYSVSRGYFNWSGYGTSGFFPHDCFSNQFKKFQERIVAAAPATFDDFEKLV